MRLMDDVPLEEYEEDLDQFDNTGDYEPFDDEDIY